MDTPQWIASATGLGLGATFFMDIVALLRQRLFNVPSLDYRLVGRWLGHMLSGRFRHDSISRAQPLRHERLTGWLFHYLTGVVFAALLLAVAGEHWFYRPTLTPALLMGVFSVAAPWLIMQPALGMGVAASNTPHPRLARLRSLTTHLSFGIGLYVTGWLWAQ